MDLTLTKPVFLSLLISLFGASVPPARANSLECVYPYFEFERGKNSSIVRWGLIDRTGSVLVPARFDAIGGTTGAFGYADGMGFRDPLIPVEVGGKWGYADRSGSLVVPAKYDEARRFAEGLALVELGDACGYIDSTGTEVVPLRFTNCSDFSEGLASASVADEERTGFIDRTGRWAIKPQFLMAEGFREGRAVVVVGDEGDLLEIMTWTGGHYRYIDKTGRFAFKEKFDKASSFSEGFARVRRDGRFAFIDQAGKVVIKSGFIDAAGFSEGLAPVSISKEMETADEYGYIDRQGSMVIAPRKWVAMPFRDGLAVVRPREKVKNQVGEVYELTERELGPPAYIDPTGRTAVAVEGARTLHPFIGELAWVGLEDGRWGYIDRTGRFAWGPKPKPF